MYIVTSAKKFPNWMNELVKAMIGKRDNDLKVAPMDKPIEYRDVLNTGEINGGHEDGEVTPLPPRCEQLLNSLNLHFFQ